MPCPKYLNDDIVHENFGYYENHNVIGKFLKNLLKFQALSIEN